MGGEGYGGRGLWGERAMGGEGYGGRGLWGERAIIHTDY